MALQIQWLLVIAAGLMLSFVLFVLAGYYSGKRQVGAAYTTELARVGQLHASELSRLRAKLETAERGAADAGREMSRLAKEQGIAAQERSRLEHALSEMSQRFSEGARTLDTAEKELRRVRGVLAKAQEENAALASEVELRKETEKALSVASASASQANQQLATVRAELSREKQRGLITEGKATDLRNKLQKVEAERERLNKECEAFTARLAAISTLEGQLAEATARIEGLERELAQMTERAGTVSAVELDREELTVRLDMAAAGVRIARKEADRYRSEVMELRAISEKQQLELHALRDKQKLQADCEADLVRARAEAAELRAEIQRVEQRAEELASQHETLEDTARDAVRQSSEHRVAKETLEAELRQYRARQKTFEQQIEELVALRERVAIVDDLKRDLSASSEERRNLERALAQAMASGRTTSAVTQERAEAFERLREENHSLRDEIRGLRIHQESTAALDRLNAEHRSLRLEAELLTRRVAELTTERSELVKLRESASELGRLREEYEAARHRNRGLEAQLYALGGVPEATAEACTISGLSGEQGAEINALMRTLTEAGNRATVLADRQGFVVATSGERDVQERLAAFSALLDDVANRAESLLPVGAIEWVRLIAQNQMEIASRRLVCGEEPLTLCTIGKSSLDPSAIDRALYQVAGRKADESHDIDSNALPT